MVVDTSTLVAIASGEPESRDFLDALHGASPRLISSGSRLEAALVVIGRFGPGAAADLDALMVELGLDVEPLTSSQATTAIDAFVTYGKGRHPAGLNFGDCFSYPLAKTTGLPLLFKGNGFTKTDVTPAV